MGRTRPGLGHGELGFAWAGPGGLGLGGWAGGAGPGGLGRCCVPGPGREFFLATSSLPVIILLGVGLGLRGRVRVNFVAMVRVSKLLESNINPNSNSALTLI